MNKNITIHIISFNVPYPANYGGVIDVFYQIKTLHELGIQIILHCFEYGRKKAPELEEYCQKVYYYPRKTGLLNQFSRLPYIVYSRRNDVLKSNLLKDNHPIIFQGVHCCFLLDQNEFKNRLKIVRLHNIEWKYYHSLYEQEKNWIKKLFFKIESTKLKQFEEQVITKHADHLLAISLDETNYLKTHNVKSLHYISAFHANNKTTSKTGIGTYALYHGDLSVKDNENAALFLIDEIFSKIDTKLILAGLNPGKLLLEKAASFNHIQVQANLPKADMESLIQNAQINILISFNSAGVKLKLLNALYNGRHCIVNQPIIQNTGLENLCHCHDDPEEIIQKIKILMKEEFTAAELLKRESALQNSPFSNLTNAKKTLNIIK